MTDTMQATGFNLFAAMAAVDLSSPPPSSDQRTAVLDGEIVLGTVSEDLVRIYHVILGVVSSIEALMVKVVEMGDAHHLAHAEAERTGNFDVLDCQEHAEKLDALDQEVQPLKAQVKNLRDIFWSLIQLEFPEVEDSQAAIREGNQIVIIPRGKNDDTVSPELESLLAVIEGMGGTLIRM